MSRFQFSAGTKIVLAVFGVILVIGIAMLGTAIANGGP